MNCLPAVPLCIQVFRVKLYLINIIRFQRLDMFLPLQDHHQGYNLY
jgi:hypothetical protein